MLFIVIGRFVAKRLLVTKNSILEGIGNIKHAIFICKLLSLPKLRRLHCPRICITQRYVNLTALQFTLQSTTDLGEEVNI